MSYDELRCPDLDFECQVSVELCHCRASAKERTTTAHGRRWKTPFPGHCHALERTGGRRPKRDQFHCQGWAKTLAWCTIDRHVQLALCYLQIRDVSVDRFCRQREWKCSIRMSLNNAELTISFPEAKATNAVAFFLFCGWKISRRVSLMLPGFQTCQSGACCIRSSRWQK